MNDPPIEPLSPAGQARRQAMLDELVAAMELTHRRRRTRRRLLGGAGCMCLALALVWLLWTGASGPSHERQFADQPDAPFSDSPTKEVQRHLAYVSHIVHTDPTVLERCRARPTGSVLRIDDRTLLAGLASINRPAGLIRIGGQVRLSAPVTDAELEINQ